MRTKLANRQLGKGRIESYRTIFSVAYASVFSFSLWQLIRHEMEKIQLPIT